MTHPQRARQRTDALTQCAQWRMRFLIPSDSTPGISYTVRFISGEGPHCTCLSYRFMKENHPNRMAVCKHIRRVMEHACMRGPFFSGGDDTISPVSNSLDTGAVIVKHRACPNCGGRMVKL